MQNNRATENAKEGETDPHTPITLYIACKIIDSLISAI